MVDVKAIYRIRSADNGLFKSRYKMRHPKSFIAAALLRLRRMTTATAAEIPAPQDILYPGALTLSVDLTDLDRRLFTVRESVPVKAGALTLLYRDGCPAPMDPTARSTCLRV